MMRTLSFSPVGHRLRATPVARRPPSAFFSSDARSNDRYRRPRKRKGGLRRVEENPSDRFKDIVGVKRWHKTIKELGATRDGKGAMEAFSSMHGKVDPHPETLNLLLASLVRAGDMDRSRSLFRAVLLDLDVARGEVLSPVSASDKPSAVFQAVALVTANDGFPLQVETLVELAKGFAADEDSSWVRRVIDLAEQEARRGTLALPADKLRDMYSLLVSALLTQQHWKQVMPCLQKMTSSSMPPR